MQIRHYIPRYPLSNFIQHMVYVSGSLPVPYIKELPQGGINLVIELNEHTKNAIYPNEQNDRDIEMRHAWISGMQKQAISYRNNLNSTIISIRFTAGGFYALTKIPITAIDYAGMEAEAILGNAFRQLYQQVINGEQVKDKFEIIENFFLRYTAKESIDQSVVRFIDQNIDMQLDQLIHRTGYSHKHLIKILKKHTGFSPKYLQRINRFHKVVNELQRCKEQVDWLSVVHRHGFYDQAHLIKDFTHFSGIRPTEYITSQLLLKQNSMVPDMILRPPERKSKGVNR